MSGNYEITMLPNSTSDLTSLKAFLIKDCRKLKSLPYLRKVNALRELNLSGTTIEEVLQGLGNLRIREPMLDSRGSRGERRLTNEMVGHAFIENPEMVLNRMEDRQVSPMPIGPSPSQTPPSLQTPMAPSPSQTPPSLQTPMAPSPSQTPPSFPASSNAVLAIRGSHYACLPSNSIRGQIKGFIWKTLDASGVLLGYHRHLLADCRSDETNGANHRGKENALSSIEPDSSRLGDSICVVFAIDVYEPCRTYNHISAHFCSNCSACCLPFHQDGVQGQRSKLHRPTGSLAV